MSGLLCLSWNNHSTSFMKLLSHLHLKELYCDATIACHGKYYPVHKFVLTTCSEYFEEIFSLAKCKHPFIIVKDVKPVHLEALLNYMYKGEVNVAQECLPELIKAAEGFKIKGLAVPDEPSQQLAANNNNTIAESNSIISNNSIDSNKDTLHLNAVEEISQGSNLPLSRHNENSLLNNINIEQPDNCLNKDIQDIKIKEEEIPKYEENLNTSEEMNAAVASSFVSSIAAFVASQNSNQVERSFDSNSNPLWGVRDNGSRNESNIMFSQMTEAEPFRSTSSSAIMNSSLDFPSGVLSSLAASTSRTAEVNSEDSSLNLPGKLYCNECSYSTFKRAHLKSHMMYKHSGQRPFPCHLCSFRFVTKSDRKKHFATHLKGSNL